MQNPEIFWSKFWDFSKILGDKGNTIIEKNKIFNKSKFFPDSKVNYTENILRKKSLDIAVNFLSEKGFEENISWKELYEKVCRLSAYLKNLDLKTGDRVAAYVPNKIETVISFLVQKMVLSGHPVHLILEYKVLLIDSNKLNQKF